MDIQPYINEKDARRDIIEAGRRMYSRGFVFANDGNLSARISENEVLTTPSGVSKGFMDEDMLIKIDLDGNVLSGSAKPSSEMKLHLAVYKTSPQLRAVNHAHPPASSVFAAAGIPLDKAYLQETVISLGVIPVAGYATPGTIELAEGAAAFSRDHHGVLLEHHGAVTWGETVMQALFRMESLEFAAMLMIYSGILGYTRTMTKEQISEAIALRPGLGITADLGEFR